ncbi:hypothetical protein AXF42_Ash008008 [Apostasia shenzhenica]|uniref:Uncharacterized protein n=1 Tax=Apostasia shenzhenica TaxID=1088818 RepID=A0A2I0A899_9ASPA|nr:hypothetical protein AXF42_Ash008008 [Apostasia shenzhenica]
MASLFHLGGGRSSIVKLSIPLFPPRSPSLKPPRVSFSHTPKCAQNYGSGAADREDEGGRKAPEKAKAAADRAKESVKQGLETARESMEEGAKFGEERAKEKTREAAEKAKEAASEATEKTKGTAQEAVERTKEGLSWAAETVKGAAKETTKKIKKTVVGKDGERGGGEDEYGRKDADRRYDDPAEEVKRLNEQRNKTEK